MDRNERRKYVRQMDRKFHYALADRLKPFGFERQKARGSFKLVKLVADGFEIYVYPSIIRKPGRASVDPIVGLDYLPLKRMLTQLSEPVATNIVHCYLCSLDEVAEEWNYDRPQITDENLIETVAGMIAEKITDIAVLRMMRYTDIAAMWELFEQELAFENPKDLIVFDAREKLAALDKLLLN